MSGLHDVWQLVQGILLVGVAGLLTMVDAALSRISKARAMEQLAEGASGARRLVQIAEDPPPYISTLLLLRLAAEVGAIVFFTVQMFRWIEDNTVAVWVTAAVMLVVSFVAIGVAPRTLGRQHSEPIALWAAGPLVLATRILGPIPRLLILIGNALTPGKGFRQGPFTTETELREMVDLAEASDLIEDEERKMIHSVFELGDTLAREVMVPRTDIVFIERHKNLKQTMSLFLKSGFSRLPVVDEDVDHIIGIAYLKDLVRRDFDSPDEEFTLKVEEMMRAPHFVPDSKPVDDLLKEMQADRQHIVVVVDEYGGTSGLLTIEDILEEIVGEITDEYDPDAVETQQVSDSLYRVSARYPVDDLDELFGIDVEDDDVDTVGGLMAKELGKVPLPGAVVEAHGMRFVAERLAGRRNRIDTILISPTADGDEDDAAYAEAHA